MRTAVAGSLVLLLLGAACASSPKKVTRAEDLTSVKKRLVRELMAKGEWKAVLPELSRMHAANPGDAEVLAMRGAAYHARGLLAEAEIDLKMAIQFDRELALAHATLAIVHDAVGRAEEAEASHRRAVDLSPQNAAYLNNYGFSLLVRGRAREAVEALREAARVAPTSARVRNNLGFALAAQGDLPAAAREFRLGGSPAERKNNLGLANERRGQLAEAQRLYEEAAKLDAKLAVARGNLKAVSHELSTPAPSIPAGAEPPHDEEEVSQ